MASPKPFSFDALGSALLSQAMATEDLERYAASSRIIEVASPLRGTGGNPVPAASVNGTTYMRYVQHNKLIVIWFQVYFGVGSTFGGGNWYLPLPVAPGLSGRGMRGELFGRDLVTLDEFVGHVEIDTSSGNRAMLRTFTHNPGLPGGPVGASNYVTSASPWAWASDQTFNGYILYEVTDAFNP